MSDEEFLELKNKIISLEVLSNKISYTFSELQKEFSELHYSILSLKFDFSTKSYDLKTLKGGL